MHFIIQENINQDDFNSLIEAINDQGFTYESFFHIPFDTSYPELPSHSGVFVYAASSVTDAIYNDHEDFKGVYNHTSQINIHNFYKNTAGLMWSPRANQCTLADVLLLPLSDDKIFVRPAIDNKLFSGQVCTQTEFIEMARKMIAAEPLYANEEIFIGGVNYPEEEYRLFIVDGDIVASSLYRLNGEVKKLEGSTNEVNKLALEFYKKNYRSGYLPLSCVIDVGYSFGENKIGVIEVNCINNSGFYGIIKADLVKALANGIKVK